MAQEKRKMREVLEAERRKAQDLENQLTQQKEVGATRDLLEDLQPGVQSEVVLLHLFGKSPILAIHWLRPTIPGTQTPEQWDLK